jgi:hypothetical protein
VSVTDFVPTKVALVSVLETPGPVNEKVWIDALSWTMNVYLPAFSCLTGLPLVVFSVIVKPGPTVPFSFVAAVVADAIPAKASAAASRKRSVRRMD